MLPEVAECPRCDEQIMDVAFLMLQLILRVISPGSIPFGEVVKKGAMDHIDT